MKSTRGGSSHAMLLKGFSNTNGTLYCKQACKMRSVKKKRALPSETLFRSLDDKPGKPQMKSDDLKGPGPKPSFFLAREKVVHGIPNQTNHIRPVLIQVKIFCSMRGHKTLWDGKRHVSIGNILCSSVETACDIRAVPANISKANLWGRVETAKTSMLAIKHSLAPLLLWNTSPDSCPPTCSTLSGMLTSCWATVAPFLSCRISGLRNLSST